MPLAQAWQGEIEQALGQDYALGRSARAQPLVLSPANWAISRSHSATHDVLALARVSQLGVDVEDIGRKISAAVQQRCFNRSESAWFAEPLSALRAWTAKEAVAKALGSGLAYGLRRLCLPERVAQNDHFNVRDGDRLWQIHSTVVEDCYVLAIALPAGPPG